MPNVCLLVVLLLASPSLVLAAPRTITVSPGKPLRASVGGSGAVARIVTLTVGDNMKFDPATITAKPGEPLKVVLKDVGQMPKTALGHNFVLLKKGADPKGFVDKSAGARGTDFIAPAVKDEVLASTNLVGPGETAEVSFVAPTRPGEYTYLCSFPGHFAMGMKGTLTVK
ncbi:MAG TPA: plastocyanin/azurin family copper-binding protein [Vicinamibacterales bacterium]|jgi:azurin